MVVLVATQAAAEYVGLIATSAVRAVTLGAERVFRFVQTPRGVLVILVVVLLLAFTVGRRRRL